MLGVSQLPGHNNHQLHARHQALFWRRCRGRSGRPLQGEFFTHTSFTLLFVLLYFTLFLLASFFIKNPKILESLVVVISLLLFIMLFPKYVLEDLSVGSGSIIGKDNIEEFFNHISMHKEAEEKSLVELAPSYEVASAYLVHMLEARFANLNPFLQYMFLKLHEIEDPKKKAFILETLRLEFKDVANEARKVFKKFNKLGSLLLLNAFDGGELMWEQTVLVRGE
jgi:hypothetical protein